MRAVAAVAWLPIRSQETRSEVTGQARSGTRPVRTTREAGMTPVMGLLCNVRPSACGPCLCDAFDVDTAFLD